MPITVGVNSYVTEAEALAYFAERFGYSSWVAEAKKVEALISATQILDVYCEWYGYPIDDDQPLAFPRGPDSTTVPIAIKNSQCEIAYLISTTGSTNIDPDDALEILKAGSVQFNFKATSPQNPIVNKLVEKMLKPYGMCSGGSTKLIPMERQ